MKTRMETLGGGEGRQGSVGEDSRENHDDTSERNATMKATALHANLKINEKSLKATQLMPCKEKEDLRCCFLGDLVLSRHSELTNVNLK